MNARERAEYLVAKGYLSPEEAVQPELFAAADKFASMEDKKRPQPTDMGQYTMGATQARMGEELSAGRDRKAEEDLYGTIRAPDSPLQARASMAAGDLGRRLEGSPMALMSPEATASRYAKEAYGGESGLLETAMSYGELSDVIPGMGVATGLLSAAVALPAKAGKVAKGARKVSDSAVGKAETGLVNAEDLTQVPDVPQEALERYDPPRGRPKGLDSILTPEAADRLTGYAEKGIKRGGREWYNTDPLRKAFVEELGEDLGAERFSRYMDFVSATSPRARVDNNIRRSSELYRRDVQGEPYVGEQLPPGYGHIAQKTHDASLKDIRDTGGFAAINRPKTSSFAENLKGNQAPMTIDTHNMAALMGDGKYKKSPTGTQYKYIEEFESDLADKMGLTPAQFQASVWVGADDITGVADSRPWLDVFDTVLDRTAKRDGVSKTEALRNFIKGDQNLWQFAGAVGLTGALTAEGMSEDDPESGRVAPGAERMGLL